MKFLYITLLVSLGISNCGSPSELRRHIDLNGEWEIAKTDSFTVIPSVFTSMAPVPGLADLAMPPVDTNISYKEGVYWYKKDFTIHQEYPEVISLKIGKAKYHAKVFLNGKFVGDHVYCFTPGVFDISRFLNATGRPNELLIGVGTYVNMPDTVVWGHDFEKLTYIPGIYDDVRVILSGYPFIRNVQVVPVIEEGKVRIVAETDDGGRSGKLNLSYVIRELKSDIVVAKGGAESPDFSVVIPNCQLWTPESPFLYELTLSTGADEKVTRFGMRSFSFDAATGQAVLNGKPYFMRGTNVTLYRFFEDPERGTLPWDKGWVVRLHEQFKNMHWNSIRYCIGLPPEQWYDIADSLGFLIQNEYPIWTGGGAASFSRIYPGVGAAQLAGEFREWLPQHWNHPSVVIWDAQNESVTDITTRAIRMVRHIDLSGRPWENGWSEPVNENDPVETHPYLFMKYRRGGQPPEQGPLSELWDIHIPDNDVNQHNPPEDKERHLNPNIINEYAWLWLNRDGSTTTLTDRVYDVVFGKDLTAGERFYIYARHLGMITEYYRAHRLCAGILHFCGLGYSRPMDPRGQTSDHFTDIRELVYEPQFVKYVRPSFAPVGLMINFWDKTVTAGNEMDIDVYTSNDSGSGWTGSLALSLYLDDVVITSKSSYLSIPENEKNISTFKTDIPDSPGNYRLEAVIIFNEEKVTSIREFTVELKD
jgi:beta-galactosidase